jgi:hypothetical protein
MVFQSGSVYEMWNQDQFWQTLPERSMYTPPLELTFGIYGEYMNMRYKIVGKNTLEMLGEHLPYCRMERPTGRIT